MKSEEKEQQTRRNKAEAKTRGREGECAGGTEIENSSKETIEEGQAAGSKRNEIGEETKTRNKAVAMTGKAKVPK